jgi:hypothetical protein
VHCCELLELSAVVATQGAVLIRGAAVIPEPALQQYWAASRSRFDRWGRALKAAYGLADREPQGAQWHVFWDVLVEVLASEVLTRTWTAVLCAHDRLHNRDEAEPVARSVYLGHLESRRRVLNFLAHISRLDPLDAELLDRLRSRCERWSDWLVAQIAAHHDVCSFAADPDRAAEFVQDLRGARGGNEAATASRLLVASLRAGFRDVQTRATPNYDLNLAIATSILGCFTPELFEGAGTMRSIQLDPLLHPADDAHGLIESLFRAERADASDTRRFPRLGEPGRWWRYGS